MERPALQRLLSEVQAKRIDVIVVYKVDRLTRSLADFAKLVELFDAHGVSFVSVTQSFNTTTSMGRLTLNVLLSFAQFEARGHRRADSATRSLRRRRKAYGWAGWFRRLPRRKPAPCTSSEDHAELVRGLFRRYLEVGSVARLKEILDARTCGFPSASMARGDQRAGASSAEAISTDIF